jgi:hypothetical protein
MALSARKITSNHWEITNGSTINWTLPDTEEPIILADGESLFILDKQTWQFEPYTPPVE